MLHKNVVFFLSACFTLLNLTACAHQNISERRTASITDTTPPPAFELGFNQGWFKNSYGSSFLNENYDSVYVDRLLDLQVQSKKSILRIWLFEGIESYFLKDSSRIPLELKPDYFINLKDFMERASKKGIKIYFTLLDGNVTLQKHSSEQKDFIYNVINNKYNMGQNYLDQVIKPTLTLLRDYRQSIWAIDLVNEINAFTFFGWFDKGWSGANAFIKEWRRQLKTVLDVPMTASLGWPQAVFQFRNNYLDYGAIDFLDIHFFNNTGTIAACDLFKKWTQTHQKKLIMGEFGQSSKRYDDQLQLTVTQKFIENAQKCGFSAALGWRLLDERPGKNPEARFSYETYGSVRPAFKWIQSQ